MTILNGENLNILVCVAQGENGELCEGVREKLSERIKIFLETEKRRRASRSGGIKEEITGSVFLTCGDGREASRLVRIRAG